jgi:hypothetical protein
LSNGTPGLVFPDVFAWSRIWIRFVTAFWIVVLKERFVGAWKSGPLRGQFVKTRAVRGKTTPRKERRLPRMALAGVRRKQGRGLR